MHRYFSVRGRHSSVGDFRRWAGTYEKCHRAAAVLMVELLIGIPRTKESGLRL